MAQSQLDNGCGTLQSVAGDRVPLDHLLAADSDLLNDDVQLVVHDASLPPVFLYWESISRPQTQQPFCYASATCCGRYVLSTAPTASGACACRCTAAVSCVLLVAPGATWKQRVHSGGRS